MRERRREGKRKGGERGERSCWMSLCEGVIGEEVVGEEEKGR